MTAVIFTACRNSAPKKVPSVSEALQPLEIVIRGTSLRIGVMLCEDGWTENYHLNVPQTLADNGAQLLCNLSCSPYTLGKNRKRNRLFSAQARTAGILLIYCNNVGHPEQRQEHLHLRRLQLRL